MFLCNPSLQNFTSFVEEMTGLIRLSRDPERREFKTWAFGLTYSLSCNRSPQRRPSLSRLLMSWMCFQHAQRVLDCPQRPLHSQAENASWCEH
ncbi:hypothetical protein QQF64_005582 [Cirrhinus molitorella]|uniref:Uncharacterized protein n=1 Tax=Cirrhinus molitorella TaxID=172907 RepID=A0ABR3MCK7_9TELE